MRPGDTNASSDRTHAKEEHDRASKAYGEIVSRKLQSVFLPPSGARPGKGRARIKFKVEHDGHAVAGRIVSSSGDAAFDRAALAIIDRAQLFPPPPGIGADKLEFEVNVEFNQSK